ncbi:MAG: ATP-dependent Clp protease proteolytic subunit [Candidatus Paceibacteria bacterium]
MAKKKTKKNTEIEKESLPPADEIFDLSKGTDIIKLLIKYKDNELEVKNYLRNDLEKLIAEDEVGKNYRVLFLYDPTGSIADYDLNKIYDSIVDLSETKKKILLVIHSNGGSIEPAYLISKICKEIAGKFIVAVPRKAKSAATLLALGADEIHMGPISQLGPIDPQVGGRPALGLGNALEYLARLVTKHPKSNEMFAKYLSFELDLKQLGYFERISESAVQYAERLLSDKELPDKLSANDVAKELTYSFKDHGFVIERKEATKWLGKYIVENSPELKLAEKLFNRLSDFDLYLGSWRKKYLVLSGSTDRGGIIFMDKKDE